MNSNYKKKLKIYKKFNNKMMRGVKMMFIKY